MSSTSAAELFQALQREMVQRERGEALATIQLLGSHPLSSRQRALLLQHHGDLMRAEGQPDEALNLWDRSLQLHFSPALALRSLELQLLPAVHWAQRPSWLERMAALVRQGQGAVLLRLLSHVLDQYPLQQQREELMEAIEQSDSLRFADQPALRGPWLRLRRLVDGR